MALNAGLVHSDSGSSVPHEMVGWCASIMGAQSRGREPEVEELGKAWAFKLCLERFIGLRCEELGKGTGWGRPVVEKKVWRKHICEENLGHGERETISGTEWGASDGASDGVLGQQARICEYLKRQGEVADDCWERRWLRFKMVEQLEEQGWSHCTSLGEANHGTEQQT